jgi:hypothetical protein
MFSFHLIIFFFLRKHSNVITLVYIFALYISWVEKVIYVPRFWGLTYVPHGVVRQGHRETWLGMYP